MGKNVELDVSIVIDNDTFWLLSDALSEREWDSAAKSAVANAMTTVSASLDQRPDAVGTSYVNSLRMWR
jgi:hypothetical protein